MNERVDLTENGDFMGRFSLIVLPFLQEIHEYSAGRRTLFSPWLDEDDAYRYVNHDTRPWCRMTHEQAEGVLCDRCGRRLTDDFPWNREYCLCSDCKRELARECHDTDNDMWKPWYREERSSNLRDGYSRVFLSEFMDRRRARG